MKKLLKKGLAIILVVMIVFPTLIITSFAKSENPTLDAVNSKTELIASNSIGEALLGNNNSTIPTAEQDFVVTDVSINDNIATVEFGNIESCIVVVAIYSEDGKMLASGIKKVEAFAKSTNVLVDIKEMPQYYIAQVYLLDNNNSSLCEPYDYVKHTKYFESFMNKTINDFDENKIIINFDQQINNNFAVLKSSAIKIHSDNNENILVSEDNEHKIYTFKNTNNELLSLKLGDIMVYDLSKNNFEKSDNLLLVKVLKISNDGDTAVVYGDNNTEMDDYFDFVKINMDPSDTENTESYVDMTNADSFVSLEENDETSFSTQSVTNKTDTGKIDWISFNLGPTYLWGGKNSTDQVYLKGTIKFKTEYEFEIHYDSECDYLLLLEPEFGAAALLAHKVVQTASGLKYRYLKVKFDNAITGEIELSGLIQKDIIMGRPTYLTPIGIDIAVEFDLHIEISAGATITIDLLSNTVGFIYDKGDIKNLSTFPKPNIKPKFNEKVTVKVSFKVCPIAEFLTIFGVEIDPEIGLKADATLLSSEHAENHLCKYCFNGKLSIYGKVNLKGEIFGKKIGTGIKLLPEFSHVLFDFYFSLDFMEFGIGKCPHVGDSTDNIVDQDWVNGSDVTNVASFEYTVSNGKATITKFIGEEKNVIIPNIIGDNYIVVAIASDAFKNCLNIEKVKLADTVTTIGNLAFGNCTNLETITITANSNLTTMGFRIFEGCTKLNSIYIPKYISSCSSSYGGSLGESNIKTVTFAEGITKIPSYICDGAAYLISVSLPNGLLGIGDYAFRNCSKLTTINIPDTVLEIGSYAFDGCSYLKSVHLSNELVGIYECAFKNCTRLENIYLPNTVTTMGNLAFGNCTNLETITITANSNLTTMGFRIFEGCTKLNSIYIPKYISSCSSSYGGSLGESNIKTVTFAEGITKIPSYICDGAAYLTSVSLPNGLLGIGDYAFRNCSKLTTINIPDTVLEIGSYAFDGCSGLANTETAYYLFVNFGIALSSDFTTSGIDSVTTVEDKDNVFTLSYSDAAAETTYTFLYLSEFKKGEELTTDSLKYICCVTSDENGNIKMDYRPKDDYKNGRLVLSGLNDDSVECRILNPIVKFDANGGTVSLTEKVLMLGETYGELPEPVKGKYNFVGWQAENGLTITQNTICTLADDHTLKAIWVDNFLFGDALSKVKQDEVISFNVGTGTLLTVDNPITGQKRTYVAIIFGDMNGDGWYDGTDAVIVNCLLSGMFTQNDLSKAQYMAADCNHDGTIDQSDVEILQQAGLLLAKIDQTKPEEELNTNSDYIEYLNLIDQNPNYDNPADNPFDEPDDEPITKTNFFQLLIEFIVKIFNYFKLHFAIIK